MRVYIILLFTCYVSIAQAQEPEHLIDIRNQRMLAEMVKNDGSESSLAILKNKVNSLPKNKEGLTQARLYIDDFMKNSADRVVRKDAYATILETGQEFSIRVYSLAKGLDAVGLKIPWVTAIKKAGDVANGFAGAVPNYWKERISNVMDPATLRNKANTQYMNEFHETLTLFDNFADDVKKANLQNSLKNQFFKEEAKKAFNNPQNKPSNLNLTIEQAEIKIRNLDKTVEENNEANTERFAEMMVVQEKTYMTAKQTQAEVRELKESIKSLQQDLRKKDLKVDEIAKKQEELSKYTERLAISVDLGFKATNIRLGNIEEKLTDLSDPVLQAIIKEDVGIGDKLKYLQQMKDGKRKSIYEDPKDLDAKLNQYKNEFKRLEIEKYCVIADKAIVYGQVGLSIMERFNIGTAKDRKFISNMITVVQGATAIARAFGGDPTALISFAMGLFSKPTPSPEMQMLKQIDERLANLEKTVENGFEGLNENLINVHKDLVERMNYITEQVGFVRQDLATNHYQTMLVLSDIKNSLNIIEAQNKAIDTKLTKVFLVDIYACEGPYNVFIGKEETGSQVIKKSKLNEYSINPAQINSFIRGQNCEPCLNGLLKFASTDFPTSLKSAFDYQITQSSLELGIEKDKVFIQPDLYKELVSLWKKRFKSDKELNYGTLAMMYPSINVSSQIGPYNKLLLSNHPISTKIHFSNTFQENSYINSQTIIDMANYFYEFYLILEIYDQSKGQIFTSIDEIRKNKDIIYNRTDRLKNALNNVRVMIDRSLAHESLMSGNMLFDTFVEILKTPNDPDSKKIFKILRSSPTIAQNFASYLISTTIKTNENFDKNLKKYDNRELNNISYENLIDKTVASFFYLTSNQRGLSIGIQKQYENLNSDGKFVDKDNAPLTYEQIELPLIQEIQNSTDANGNITTKEIYVVDRLLPNDGFLALLDVREKISALIDQREELDNITTDRKNNTLSNKDLDFLLYENAVVPLSKSNIYSNGNTTLCEGEKIIISSEIGQSTYKWYKNGTLLSETSDKLTVTTSGNYQVAYSSKENPSDFFVKSDSVNVVFKPKPQKPSISITSSGLKSSSEKNNQWFLDGTLLKDSTNQSIKGFSGTYMVRVTENGCFSDSDIFVITSNELYSSFNINLYPNPNDGKFWIEIPELYKTWDIRIYDINGKEILTKKQNNNNNKEFINFNSTSGLYLLKLTNGSNVHTIKFSVD